MSELDLWNQIREVNMNILQLLNNNATLYSRLKSDVNQINIAGFDELLSCLINANKGPLTNYAVKELFITILKTTIDGFSSCKNKLLVSSPDKGFMNITEMFDSKPQMPILIAGPCSIENYNYLDEIGRVLYEHNIQFIRGGAYKSRTSPYSFQGLGENGLKILKEISRKYNLISVTEVVDIRDVEFVSEYADILQIGARNMHNYELLKEIGRSKCPVILKRGMSASIEEFIYAAEYIALQGNKRIILCERGIRTFETKTRNTLDISCVPIIKKETILPIIVDISHSLGRKDIINPIARSVLAAGADGIMVEVHPVPAFALSDNKQQLNIDEFKSLLIYLGFLN